MRAAIQVAVPEREHSANARDTRRLRRMAKMRRADFSSAPSTVPGELCSVETRCTQRGWIAK